MNGELHALPGRRAKPKKGVVHLVGAGPGNPELLTVAALNLLREADALVYDRLVSKPVLALARAAAERHYVGKQTGCHTLEQQQINTLLAELAMRHSSVVRLKGGDPLIFGRGGEEALSLRAAGITVNIVPGITAAQAAAAALGMPLTQRGTARGVHLATGHFMCNAPVEFSGTVGVDPAETLVVYMGLASCDAVSRHLLEVGRSAETPVAIVENATLPDERCMRTSVGQLSATVSEYRVRPPALLIVGDVVELADDATALLPSVVNMPCLHYA